MYIGEFLQYINAQM